MALVVIGCDRGGADPASSASTLDLGACGASVRYSSRRFFVATDGAGTDSTTGETVRTVELAENSQEVRNIYAGRGPATTSPR